MQINQNVGGLFKNVCKSAARCSDQVKSKNDERDSIKRDCSKDDDSRNTRSDSDCSKGDRSQGNEKADSNKFHSNMNKQVHSKKCDNEGHNNGRDSNECGDKKSGSRETQERIAKAGGIEIRQDAGRTQRCDRSDRGDRGHESNSRYGNRNDHSSKRSDHGDWNERSDKSNKSSSSRSSKGTGHDQVSFKRSSNCGKSSKTNTTTSTSTPVANVTSGPSASELRAQAAAARVAELNRGLDDEASDKLRVFQRARNNAYMGATVQSATSSRADAMMKNLQKMSSEQTATQRASLGNIKIAHNQSGALGNIKASVANANTDAAEASSNYRPPVTSQKEGEEVAAALVKSNSLDSVLNTEKLQSAARKEIAENLTMDKIDLVYTKEAAKVAEVAAGETKSLDTKMKDLDTMATKLEVLATDMKAVLDTDETAELLKQANQMAADTENSLNQALALTASAGKMSAVTKEMNARVVALEQSLVSIKESTKVLTDRLEKASGPASGPGRAPAPAPAPAPIEPGPVPVDPAKTTPVIESLLSPVGSILTSTISKIV